jgi:hypothetical protein
MLTCNPRTHKAKTGGWQVQGQAGLQKESEASLGYIEYLLQRNKGTNKNQNKNPSQFLNESGTERQVLNNLTRM